MSGSRRRIVVTGVGCATPLGLGAAASWNALLEGRSGVRAVEGLDERQPSKIAAPAPDDLEVTALSPKEQRRYDRVIVLALAAAGEALADAGLEGGSKSGGFDADRGGIAIGSGIGGINSLLDGHESFLAGGPRRVTPFLVPMALSNMPAGVAAIHYGLRGPNLCHVTACATGAHATGEAARIIERGDADLMVVGGAESPIHPMVLAGFARMQALSLRNDDPEQASRPFDTGRDGFVLGEGAGVLVLESEEHARARGARIRARLAGYGASGDAAHMAAPDESGRGAIQCMRQALADADLAPSDVDYVNAHATSTPAGDRVEAAALRSVFGETVDSLAVSSTKGATGHLMGAAGAVEAIFSILALEEQLLPPTRNLDDPDPECALDHVAHKPRPARIRAVLSNSFGFGGVNAALLFAHGDQ
ncbi:MAG: beta-ketoacyl-ACP synthase II [Myxococcota bacterium]|nr:beta-ketoacyl-ACP synthase II [Myxococcota bacterium]